MDISKRGSKPNVAERMMAAVNRWIAPPPVAVPVEKRAQNLALKQANIRAVAMREGFQSILLRSNEMARHVESFKNRQRTDVPGAEPQESTDVHEETIVLSSESTPYSRGRTLS